MPEFELDHGDQSERFESLDWFTQAYIAAIFWTEGADDNACDGKSLDDFAPEAWDQAIRECKDFQELANADLAAAYEDEKANYDPERAGVDFWLTRNGHGAGFWDRGLGDLRTDTVGGRLSRDAKSMGLCDAYLGDDGLIYLS